MQLKVVEAEAEAETEPEVEAEAEVAERLSLQTVFQTVLRSVWLL
jgi:hypothetical protein